MQGPWAHLTLVFMPRNHETIFYKTLGRPFLSSPGNVLRKELIDNSFGAMGPTMRTPGAIGHELNWAQAQMRLGSNARVAK